MEIGGGGESKFFREVRSAFCISKDHSNLPIRLLAVSGRTSDRERRKIEVELRKTLQFPLIKI